MWPPTDPSWPVRAKLQPFQVQSHDNVLVGQLYDLHVSVNVKQETKRELKKHILEQVALAPQVAQLVDEVGTELEVSGQLCREILLLHRVVHSRSDYRTAKECYTKAAKDEGLDARSQRSFRRLLKVANDIDIIIPPWR